MLIHIFLNMGISEDIKQEVFKSELEKAVINIMYTNNWLSSHQIEMFKPFGLTTPQFNVLRILRGQYPQPATINLLIERMLDKSSNASRIVDKLEAKGLVARKQCKEDRRAVDVIISEQGLEVLKNLDNVMRKWEEGFQKMSSTEFETLNLLLDKFRTGK